MTVAKEPRSGSTASALTRVFIAFFLTGIVFMISLLSVLNSLSIGYALGGVAIAFIVSGAVTYWLSRASKGEKSDR